MVSPNQRVRVLIADADYMGSQLMANALNRYRNDFEVVGIANSSQETVQKIQTCKPDVSVLSPGLRDGDRTGLQVLEKMRDFSPRTTPILLLHSLDRETVVDAFCAGARGIISRADSFQVLAKCIRCVHKGQVWANNQQIEYLIGALPQHRPRLAKSSRVSALTPREKEVIRLLAEGMKNREIARALQITEHTVSNYLYRIFEKVGVSSRLQLILYALSHKQAA